MKKLSHCGYTVPLLDSLECVDLAADREPVVMILMPRLETFDKHLMAVPAVKESDLVQLCCDIGHALAACHREKIIHRDMKAGNLYCHTVNGLTRYLLGDFGAARDFSACVRPSMSVVVGNSNEYDPYLNQRKPFEYDNDIFALCHLVGKELIGEEKIEIGREFMAILERGMSDDRSARYKKGAEFLEDVKNLGANNSNRGTVIRTKQNFRQAMDNIRQGFYDKAEEYADKGRMKESGCDVLYLYCRLRKTTNAIMRGEGNNAMLRELLREANRKTGEANGQPFRVMSAMINRMLGEDQLVESTLKICAETGYVPAMYYYGCFVCSGELDGAYDEGVRCILKAAKKGCAEAVEYLQQRVTFSRCGVGLQEEIRAIRNEGVNNPDDAIYRERQKRIPLLLRYI